MVRPSRAAAVKDGRSSAATALAARSVLDGREHDGKLACAGIDRVLTARSQRVSDASSSTLAGDFWSSNHKEERPMKATAILGLMTMALLCSAVAMPAGDARAQQKQRLVFKVDAANSKYTQQHTIDVGDVSGHQVRLFEIRRTYPSNAPVINGTKIVESWARGITDYIENNGAATTYGVYVLENGDKFFTRAFLVAVQSPGASKLTATTVGPITGGTGTLAGIQGVARTLTSADPKVGFNETQVEIEYWLAN